MVDLIDKHKGKDHTIFPAQRAPNKQVLQELVTRASSGVPLADLETAVWRGDYSSFRLDKLAALAPSCSYAGYLVREAILAVIEDRLELKTNAQLDRDWLELTFDR